jgi:flagellin
MASLYAQKNLSTAQADLAGSVQKLSSGKRINSAKDDAAGYAVAEAVKATKNITDQSIQNTQDAISLVQTAEGALDVVGKMLQRALTLTTQKENGSLTTTQTTSINNEIQSLLSEVAKVNSRTRFQGGAASIFGTSSTFTTGSGTTSSTQTTVNIFDLSTVTLSKSATGIAAAGTIAAAATGTLTLSTGIDGSIATGMKIYKNGIDTGRTVTGTGDTAGGYGRGTTSITVSSGTLALSSAAGDSITFHAASGASTSSTATTSATQTIATTGLSLTVPALSAAAASSIGVGARVYQNGVDTGRVVTSTPATNATAVVISAGDAVINVASGDVFTFITQREISTTSSSTDIMNAVQNNIINRAQLGSYQQQLNYIVDNMQTLSNNLADAQSRIVDTNYAAETANLTRGQILQQAATSMLAQANQMPNVILTLLK